MENKTVYIGNLNYSITEEQLKSLFEKVGPVFRAQLIMDHNTNKPRGFAFVEFEKVEDANKAIETLNGEEFEGRALVVKMARPREPRS